MTSRTHATVFAAIAVLVMGAIVGSVAVYVWPPIKVLDGRFHVGSVMATRGDGRVILIENRLLEQIRARTIRPVERVKFPAMPARGLWSANDIYLQVVYHWDGTPGELLRVDADLVNSDGEVFRIDQVSSSSWLDNYLGIWTIDFTKHPMTSTNAPNWSLCLKRPNDGGDLAVIKLGNFPQ
jgi:hypothetical protein